MKNKTWTKQTILAGTAIAALAIGYTASAAESENNPSDAAISNTPPAALERYGGFGLQQHRAGTSYSDGRSNALGSFGTNRVPLQSHITTGMRQLPQPAQAVQPSLLTLPFPQPSGERSVPPGPRMSFDAQKALLANPPNRAWKRNPDAAFDAARASMVTNQIAGRGIVKPGILDAMKIVPRHQFIPAENLAEAYSDKPVEVGPGRMIESPYAVAAVADQLDPKPTDRLLELGTGSGYQTAVLSLLVKEVYTIEDSKEFAARSRVNLQRLGYTNNIFVKEGDLAQGWPEAAPFDAIVVNSGLDAVPDVVLKQLKEGGRIIFAGAQDGNLHSMRKFGRQIVKESSRPVRLSPAAANNVELPAVRAATASRP